MPRPSCLCSNQSGVRCDAARCDRVRLGSPYTLDQCRPCWLFFHRPQYHHAQGGTGETLAGIDIGSVPHTLFVKIEGTIYAGSYPLTARPASSGRAWLYGDPPSTMALFYHDGDWRFIMRCATAIDYKNTHRSYCRAWTRDPLRIEFDAICPCCGRQSCRGRPYTATVTAAYGA